MIYILLGQPRKRHQKNSFQATTFKVEENSRTFQGKMEFKDFSRLCEPWFISLHKSGLLIFRGKKSKILRDFQWQIRGEIGRFRGKKVKIRGKIGRFREIFVGEKSKFAQKSADFAGF